MRIHRPDREPDVEIRVLGRCAPGGSKDTGVIYRKGPNGTKVPVIDADGKIKTFVRDNSGEGGKHWRSAVAKAGHEAMNGAELLDGPLYVEVTLIRRRGPGHYGQGRNRGLLLPSAPAYPATAPDATKLMRSTEDALTGVVWRDDSRNCTTHVEKVFAEPGEPEGAEIRVWTLEAQLGESARMVPDQLALSA
jgi:Holliday junction resolvase RusA-like endonuclease